MKLRRITGLIKTSGLIQELKEMRHGSSPAGEITGGAVGALAGAAAGAHNMTQSVGGLSSMAAANKSVKPLRALAGVAAKRVLPWALIVGAIGTLAGSKVQDVIRKK